jgi:hypothetical protein
MKSKFPSKSSDRGRIAVANIQYSGKIITAAPIHKASHIAMSLLGSNLNLVRKGRRAGRASTLLISSTAIRTPRRRSLIAW